MVGRKRFLTKEDTIDTGCTRRMSTAFDGKFWNVVGKGKCGRFCTQSKRMVQTRLNCIHAIRGLRHN